MKVTYSSAAAAMHNGLVPGAERSVYRCLSSPAGPPSCFERPYFCQRGQAPAALRRLPLCHVKLGVINETGCHKHIDPARARM